MVGEVVTRLGSRELAPDVALGLPGFPGTGSQFGLDGDPYAVRDGECQVDGRPSDGVPEVPHNQLSLGVEGRQLDLPNCPVIAVNGVCQEDHHYAKEVICNREWCEEGDGRCGGDGGPAHQRRKARWFPKARKIGGMGHFVFTLPPEVRHKYRTQKALGKLGTSAKRMMQRHSYKRGLRRWHLFGEDHPGQGLQGDGLPNYHPHLEALVDGQWLGQSHLDAMKQSWANILKVPVDRINIRYEYIQPWDTRRKLHRISYALRPTFTDSRWDPELAHELIGFHNAQTWGSKADWDGPDLWEVPEGESDGSGSVEALEEGRCPIDGTPIKWGGLLNIRNLREPFWQPLGAGYWMFNGLARDDPG